MPETSIVITATDRYSSVLKSMSDVTKGFDKNAEHLERTLHELSGEKSILKAETDKARKAMQEAQKQFANTHDEADGLRASLAGQEYEDFQRKLTAVNQTMKATEKQIKSLGETERKTKGSSGGGFGKNIVSALAISGIGDTAKQLLQDGANTLVGSYAGDEGGTLFSNVLSSASAGLTAGLMTGNPLIIAAATGIGAIAGGVSGSIQNFQKKDDAFKDYYKSIYETVNQATEESLTGGKALAASRETNKLSFTTLLGGEGQADAFLGDVLKTANTTPFLYDDLVGISKTLLSFGYAVDDIIPTLTKVGDAGAAMGLSTADIGTVATYIGRMKSSDKASLEYLNPLNERGLGVFQWLADDLKISQKAVYDKISKGELSGSYVSDLILSQFEKLYGGMMEIQSRSTEGLDSTLQGLLENIDAAGGSRYNELRNEGKEADINAYGGQLGQAMENVNALAGETKARLENLEGQYEREALSAVLLGEKTSLFSAEDKAKLDEMRQKFIDASNVYEEGVRLYGKGDLGAAQEMVNLQEDAKAVATAAYESSGEYQKVQDQTLDQIDAIRANTIGLEAATNEYRISNAFTKGLGSWMPKFISTVFPGSTGGLGSTVSPEQMGDGDPQDWNRHAYGLKRVPFDGYPALLHQDERVLTAAEAREQGSGGLQVTFSGPITVRQDSDLDEIARRLADKLEQARMRAG